jgi:dihydroflavonol-4-reductase
LEKNKNIDKILVLKKLSKQEKMTNFLVTGATGFIALHVVDQLLKCGYFVRGIVGNVKEKKQIEPLINLANKHLNGKLEITEADLLDPNSWREVLSNINIIIHFCSPFPIQKLDRPLVLFEPTVIGTLNVLKAALNTNVKRIVINSCFTTISGVHPETQGNIFDEMNWIDVI